MPNKNRPQPARLVETLDDIVEREDGGIFWHEKVIGQKRGTITSEERDTFLTQLPDVEARLRASLSSAELQAREIVSPYANQYPQPVDPPPGHVMTGLDLGDGPRATVLPAKLPDEAAEAVDVLRLVRSVRRMLDRDPDAARVLATLYDLGRCHERMLVRPHEPDALSGKRGRTTRPEGARTRKAANDETRRKTIVKAVKKNWTGNRTLTQARRLAADELTRTHGYGFGYDAVLAATRRLRK